MLEITIAQHKKIPTATCSILIIKSRFIALSDSTATSYGSLIVLSTVKHAMYGHMFLWVFFPWILQNNKVRYKLTCRES